jgi:phage terminase large subunit GpA-like protein
MTELQFKNSARRVVAGALARVFSPPLPMKPSEWARQYLIVPDGPRKLEPWDASLTPYIDEPLDLTSTEAPENEFCVMKSAQTGFTTMLLAAAGHTIDRDKADTMIVQPTDGALSDFNSKKLQPCLEETKPTRELVAPQTSRTGAGSTTYEKKFGRYTLSLALASSSADLRSKSIQKAFEDEIDEYPEDLDGQGSPFGMIEARQEAFLKSGTWKRVKVSTPTIKGASPIDDAFEASDKRRWHVPCPHCAHEFVLEFGPSFRFQKEWPFAAEYACPGCGAIIEEHHRVEMNRGGRWIATEPEKGRSPGFHFNALSSPFVPWSVIAKRHCEAGDSPSKLKTFFNLTLGLPYEFRGNAPDHVRLMERREEGFTKGHVPPRGLLLVAAADVQMRGIWVEVLAIAPDRQAYLVDALYLDGATEAPDGESFELLRRVLDREYPDAFGRTRRLDGLAVDSGYRSHVVYAWVRANQRIHPDTGLDMVLAVDGRDGWGRPAIGTPSLVDIDLAGRKVKKGCKVWPVGTWPLKGAFYEDLNKDGVKSGKTCDPEGYCHFGTWVDEGYFRQLTAEYLAEETFRGRQRKIWKIRASERDNHFLDCFDPATELLTESGWVGVAEAREGMRFATVDLGSDEIVYQQPTSVIARRHCGEMIEVKGRRIDILVTPNHRMVTYHVNPPRPGPEITLAGDLTIWDKIKLTATWKGDDGEKVFVPAMDVGARGNNRNKQNAEQQLAKELDAGDLAELLGWYVAEGHRGKGAKHSFHVAFTQIAGKKQDYIFALLSRLGWAPRIEEGQRILVNSRQLFGLVDACYDSGAGRGCYRKRVPAQIKAASPRIIARFVDGAIAGDGWTQCKGKSRFRTYATTSKLLADDMQELFIKLGCSSSISKKEASTYNIEGRFGLSQPQYWVSECKTPAALLRQSDNTPIFRRVPYEGMVHCVSVPNGTLIARRSGKSFIVGNCRVYNMALAEYLGLSSLTKDEWAALAKRRGMPDEVLRADLFRPKPPAELAAAVAPAPGKKPDDIFDRFAALNAQE